jgi:hypothetical protein
MAEGTTVAFQHSPTGSEQHAASRLHCRFAWKPVLSPSLLVFHRTSTPLVGLDLRALFFEGIGDRVLEAQRRPVASGGVPRLCAVACAGGLQEGCFDLA